MLRFAYVVAASVLLTGCAIFEPPAATRASSQLRGRVTLKADPPPTPVVPQSTPKIASNSGSTQASVPLPAAPATAASEQSSCGTADQCALLLRLMVDDPNRSWINLRPSAASYANGTRLFAYLALRAKLSCHELRAALDEMHTAESFLNGSIPGLTLDQVARARTLNAHAIGELDAEHVERCKSDLARSSG